MPETEKTETPDGADDLRTSLLAELEAKFAPILEENRSLREEIGVVKSRMERKDEDEAFPLQTEMEWNLAEQLGEAKRYDPEVGEAVTVELNNLRNMRQRWARKVASDTETATRTRKSFEKLMSKSGIGEDDPEFAVAEAALKGGVSPEDIAELYLKPIGKAAKDAAVDEVKGDAAAEAGNRTSLPHGSVRTQLPAKKAEATPAEGVSKSAIDYLRQRRKKATYGNLFPKGV